VITMRAQPGIGPSGALKHRDSQQHRPPFSSDAYHRPDRAFSRPRFP
jgi:hypothetical protein